MKGAVHVLHAFVKKTLLNMLVNASGHRCALLNQPVSESQTAISLFVFSFRTFSTRSKNFQTIPATTPPAANCPGGELMRCLMVVRVP